MGLTLRKLFRRRSVVATALLIAAGVVFVSLSVWRARAPRTSRELLQEIIRTPPRAAFDLAEALARLAAREGIVAFVRAVELPDKGAEARLITHVESGTLGDLTVPFVLALLERYRPILGATDAERSELAYGNQTDRPVASAAVEPAEVAPSNEASLIDRIEAAMKRSAAVREHLRTFLRLYDALFLRVLPDAPSHGPLRQRYAPEAYVEVKEVIRETFKTLVRPATDDALAPADPKSEYEKALEELISDDERLQDLAEFLTDLVRDIALDWVKTFERRERRLASRAAWVEDAIARGRYDALGDWAAFRNSRRLAVHIVVDGLQGLLLEGLVRLAEGDRGHPAAAYVIDLVARMRAPRFDPSTSGSGAGAADLPGPLGRDIALLADGGPAPPHYLNNFRHYFYSPQAPATVVHVASVDTPSISVRNLPVAFSGHTVGGPHGTGIPNFSYLDRQTGRGWYFWGSDIVHISRIFSNRENEIPGGKPREGPGARMLHERLPTRTTMSVGAMIDAGALEKLFGPLAIAVGELKKDLVEQSAVLRLRERARMERNLLEHRNLLVAHRDTRRTWWGALVTEAETLSRLHEAARYLAEHDDDGLPDYLLWYNPWPDHFAHYTGPFADAIVGFEGEIDRLDFFCGKVLGIYEATPAAGGGTFLDRTLVGVTSDHGLAYTPKLVSTDQLLFEALAAEGKRVLVKKLTHDEGGLPAIHGESRPRPTRGFDAVVGSTAGGSYIVDLFYPDEKRWAEHPGWHDLRALPLRRGGEVDWIDAVLRHLGDHLDLAVVRERGPAVGEPWADEVDAAVRVVTPRGEARITRLRSGRIRYEPLGPDDPLDLVGAVRPFLLSPGSRVSVEEARDRIAAAVADPAGRSEEEWVTLLSATRRPDVVPQLVRIYDSDRAGTINIFPADNVGMNSSVVGRHAGETFEEKNGILLLRVPGVAPGTRLQSGRSGSLAVTLYEWLEGSGGVGFGYPSLLVAGQLAGLRASGADAIEDAGGSR